MLTSLLVFAGTALLFAMIPGPDFALILRVSLLHGRRPSIFAAVGIGCGLIVHTALSVAGLTAVIAHSPFLFKCITYAGAAYLAYIGLRSLLARPARPEAGEDGTDSGTGARTAQTAHPDDVSSRAAFVQGFLTNVLNPKAVIFFLTFLPQFIVADAPLSVPVQLLILGICMVLIVAVWFITLSLLLSRLRKYLESETFRRRLEVVTGTVFLGFSVKLLATSN
ncbi:MAG: LysE family translocator [Desulfovibrionaceae bacterium]|nr:LysE family translocator [Desulfovibrionaceae bacterium]